MVKQTHSLSFPLSRSQYGTNTHTQCKYKAKRNACVQCELCIYVQQEVSHIAHFEWILFYRKLVAVSNVENGSILIYWRWSMHELKMEMELDDRRTVRKRTKSKMFVVTTLHWVPVHYKKRETNGTSDLLTTVVTYIVISVIYVYVPLDSGSIEETEAYNISRNICIMMRGKYHFIRHYFMNRFAFIVCMFVHQPRHFTNFLSCHFQVFFSLSFVRSLARSPFQRGLCLFDVYMYIVKNEANECSIGHDINAKAQSIRLYCTLYSFSLFYGWCCFFYLRSISTFLLFFLRYWLLIRILSVSFSQARSCTS